MSRRFWGSLALFAIIVAVALAVARPGGSGEEHASAQEPSGITISLDMDTTDGPCTDIDASTSHNPGDSYDVAICVEGLYEGYPVAIIAFDVLYDDTLNYAPEVADTGQGLDDNPDFNDNEYGDGLGDYWFCSGGGAAYPKGDKDAGTGPGHGDAFIACRSSLGPWTLGDDETSGVIAVIHFVAAGYAGTDTLTIEDGLLGYSDAGEMGTCNPEVHYPMTCNGGTDIKGGTPMPTPTVTPTPTWTVTPLPGPPGPTPTPTPTWTVTPLPGPPGPTPTWTVTPLPGPPGPTPTWTVTPLPGPPGPTPTPTPALSVSLDMDTTDGPCTDIDSTVNHSPGDSYYVAICVENLYEGYPIGLIAFDVVYDDTLNTVPEVADVGLGLDDNPDFNENEYGDGLGSGWDCTGSGAAYPRGDRDGDTGPGQGDVFLSCRSALGPWTLGDDETSGVIARIHFQAIAGGTDALTIANGLLGYPEASEMGTCNPGVWYSMTCNGGTDVKIGAPPTVATVTATALPTATSTPAGQGSISGVVTDSQGDPLEDAWVWASPAGDIPVSPPLPPAGENGAWTGPDGTYTIIGLATGQYVVEARAEAYVREYYDGARDYDDATLVVVTEGQDTSNIDFSLDLGGTISGVVTDSQGDPIEGAWVSASPSDLSAASERVYAAAISPPPIPPGEGGNAQTGPDGTYTIVGLTTGAYVLEAEAAGYLDEYYDGARRYDDATPVVVTEGQDTPDIDFTMDVGGTISGVVKDSQGNPIENAWVYANPYDWHDDATSGYEYSGPDGSYTIEGLATDSYRVQAEAGYYVPEYYDGVRDYDEATPVEVTEAQNTPDIDFTMDVGGTISGVVKDSQGNPIESAWVYAYPYGSHSDATQGYTYSGPDGSYTIEGLATDEYRVRASAGGYINEYYDDVHDYYDATPVAVIEGQDTPGIDFSLVVGGRISCQVADADENPIEDARCCQAYYPEQWFRSCCYTDSEGACSMGPLVPQSYVLRVEAEGYLTEYYDGAREYDDATPVDVEEAEEVAVEFSLDLGGTISGVVTDDQGDPLEGAWVIASPTVAAGAVYAVPISPPPSPPGGGSASTDADGKYTIRGLATGAYIVSAGGDGYSTQYYDGVASEDDATPVGVTEGQDTSDIDFSLHLRAPGDANGDGDVGMADAMLIAQCVMELNDCGSIDQEMADVNCSGGVTMVDAMLVAQYVMGLIDEFPCS